MNLPPLVPPLKCQGIKTKLAGEIKKLAQAQEFDRWVEPFCGSCVVALNVQPKRALLTDSNVHIIRLYQEIQRGSLTPSLAKASSRRKEKNSAPVAKPTITPFATASMPGRLHSTSFSSTVRASTV